MILSITKATENIRRRRQIDNADWRKHRQRKRRGDAGGRKIVVVGRTIIGSTSNFGIVRYGYGANAQANDGFLNLDAATALRFDNAFQSGTTVSALVSSLVLPPLPANLKVLMSPRSIRTFAGFSGDVIVKFNLPTRIDTANFNAAQILHFENGAWIDRTTNAPPRDFATHAIYARASSLGEFAVVSPLAQTTETTVISGRILMANGRSSAGSVVTLTDSNGQINYTISNAFGYYRFLNVVLRENYIIRVASKRARFSPSNTDRQRRPRSLEFCRTINRLECHKFARKTSSTKAGFFQILLH